MNGSVDPLTVTASGGACDWPVTNCYIDVWMSILRGRGLDPIAGAGVTVTQHYEGDQFTFFKYPPDDLEKLYGAVIGELTVWRELDVQIATQVQAGRLVLAEVDGYYLPDTRATSYRTQHTKTTIGVDGISLDGRRLTYFHNIGHYELAGDDYGGIFRRLPGQDAVDDVLAPYVEFVRWERPALSGDALADTAVALLRRHLRRRPKRNPIALYRADFPARMDWLMAHPERFHEYAFAVFRQLGANFQLLGMHIDWLGAGEFGHLADAAKAAAAISATAKALQFKVARIASRRHFDPCDALFDTLEDSYESVMDSLIRGLH